MENEANALILKLTESQVIKQIYIMTVILKQGGGGIF